MPGYFDARIHAKSLLLEKAPRSRIVFPKVGGDSSEATRLRLLSGPLQEPLPYSLAPVAGLNRHAIHQKTFPILSLVNRLQHSHSILGEKALLLVTQPLSGEGVDHPDDDTLVHGDETIAPRKPASTVLDAARHQPGQHLFRRHFLQQKFIHSVAGRDGQFGERIGVARQRGAKEHLFQHTSISCAYWRDYGRCDAS